MVFNRMRDNVGIDSDADGLLGFRLRQKNATVPSPQGHMGNVGSIAWNHYECETMSAIKFLVRSAAVCVLVVIALVGSFILGLGVSGLFFGGEYPRRLATHRDSSVQDLAFFPHRQIRKSAHPDVFPPAQRTDISLPGPTLIAHLSGDVTERVTELGRFLDAHDTTGFVILRNGHVLYEHYPSGFARSSVQTSFSMAKSVTSMLIGAAIQDGLIRSVDAPVFEYLPDYPSLRTSHVTIRDLLMMRSGLSYDRTRPFWIFSAPWDDDTLTYWAPNLRRLCARERAVRPPATTFEYNDYHPLLLGLILERVTHGSVSEYLQNRIWRPSGMEFDASWSLDSADDGFEKMESGLNARSIDFARLGQLMLDHGQWNGREVLPSTWIAESTARPAAPAGQVGDEQEGLATQGGFYAYMWWGLPTRGGATDFYADGKFGQYIYVSPINGVVIVRNGHSEGRVEFWPVLLREIANRAALTIPEAH